MKWNLHQLMDKKNATRIDKWLWAVRIFKTRSLATEACAGGKIKINENTVKPSRMIRPGDIIQARKGIVKYEYKVLNIAKKRMGAKMVQDFLQDLTPDNELAKLETSNNITYHTRDKGKGRPTKKERRNMDKFRSNP